MADDVRLRLRPRVVTSLRLLELEQVSRDRGYNQNLDPGWLSTVIPDDGHHLIAPALRHPARTAGEEDHLRSLLRIQLRGDLESTDAPAMVSLLDLPFEVFEALPEPTVGVLNWIAHLTTDRLPSVAQVIEGEQLAHRTPDDTPRFPIWGTIVWLTSDQGGRRNGPPPTPWDTYYYATAFVPPSRLEDGLASVAINVSVRNAWQSHAKLGWLLDPHPAVDRGSVILISEGPKTVAAFIVEHVSDLGPFVPTPLSGQRLSEIEDREAAASPGPWTSSIEGRDHDSGEDFILTGSEGKRGADLYLTWDPLPDVVQRHFDQDFIAQARQDVPDMAAEIRRLWDLLALQPRGSTPDDPRSGVRSTPDRQVPTVYVVQADTAGDIIQLGAFTSMKEAVKAMNQAQAEDPATAWVINALPVHETAQEYVEDR